VSLIPEETIAKFRRLMELREAEDVAKAEYTAAKREAEELEDEIWDEMAESGLAGALKLDLGEPWGVITFQNKETFYARINDAEAARAYFAEHFEEEPVTEQKFVMARLNEVVREAIDTRSDLPPGVDWRPKRFVSVTRQK
jgi:hypothetical protein